MSVRVQLNVDELYATQDDPWGIGAADNERYDLYYELVCRHAGDRSSILDVGSGFGAFLARFRDDFDSLTAVEVSRRAVEVGSRRHPFIEFHRASADALAGSVLDGRRYGAVIYSDVINYLDDAGKASSLEWIADHLRPEGVALIAAWSPGGRYLSVDELEALVKERFALVERQVLPSGHSAFVTRRKRWLAALTVDYETWQPIPSGKTIDWERDVFASTSALLDAADDSGARITLFAEMGEYFWLRANDPLIAARMERQWRDAVRRGHDVQLHLHPSWLPELGARRDADSWTWDLSRGRAADYPGDLGDLIGRCVEALRAALRPVDPNYEVSCFRAGAYEAQPFTRIYDALAENGIGGDSSVYAGGARTDRGYDYSLAYSTHQPYFASRYDPQLKAPPVEQAVVELPLFSYAPNERWTFDGSEGTRFAGRLLDAKARRRRAVSVASARRRARLRELGALVYHYLRPVRPLLNRVLPRALAHSLTGYGTERLVENEYFTLVGHSKATLDMDAIRDGMRVLAGAFELVTVSEMARSARAELEATVSASPAEEADRQVRREYATVLGQERNEVQSFRLQELIPLDRRRILDLGCGAGDWAHRIAAMYPWMEVVGVDVGNDFIGRARETAKSERVSFRVEDFADLSFDDAVFDCAYADNSLEHAFDVDRALGETCRVLRDGGVLVAAIPSDARGAPSVCDNHTWKTAPHDVQMRLKAAGFVDVDVTEVDTFRQLGMPPFPPSCDRMMYVTAWKRNEPASQIQRARELSAFVYDVLAPDRAHAGNDLVSVLSDGVAWCTGYALGAGLLLQREGFRIRWLTLLADGPPPTGGAPIDAHEVLEVEFGGGRRRVLDPMANVWFDASIVELLRDPRRADVERTRDRRYVERGYDLYATSAWYRRVRKAAVREDPRDHQEFHPLEEWLAGAVGPRGGVARRLLRAREQVRARLRTARRAAAA